MVDDRVFAESDHEVTDADGDCLIGHGYIPIDAKKMANSPSRTMTRKIDFTTEVVVCLPSDSALPLHLEVLRCKPQFRSPAP